MSKNIKRLSPKTTENKEGIQNRNTIRYLRPKVNNEH